MLRWLFSLLFNRYVFIAIGLCALALAIWYLGPLFAFAQWRPLEPVPARLWLMGAIAFLLLLKWLAGVWRKHRINTRLIDSVMGLRDKSVPADDPSRAALEEMRANFAQALTQLKKARFGKQGGGWWAQFRQKYAYQIPWYVFIGAPGSGKTTALVNSGLRFPLAEELGGKESIRGVGGTRSCDWWFADEAVLLDTAGRFTTHESDAVADKAEWSGFLQLLRKFRPRQPLNGAILTISVWDLLSLSEDERKAHAALLRARLNELTDNLRIAFPIYVLVTKVDLLGGFNEYFENFSKEDRAQVWGVTLPLQPEQELTREALGKQLEQEMQSLARRLFDKLPDVMQEGHDTARRARAYTLPQHFSNLTPLVRQLVQNVFADSRFAPTAMLRGVYFTSGTQEGTPFDRLLGSLQNSLGLDASVALQSVPKTGKSFFLQDLLHKVVFPEAHLAGRNRRVERRDRILGVASHLGIALVLALVVLGWVTSYGKNTQYLQFVDIKTTMTSGYLKGQNSGEAGTLLDMLPALNVMEHLADGQNFAVGSPPIANTLGLYQGNKLGAATRTTYARALQTVMLPRVVRRVEEVLQTTPDDNLELTYEALKVYLMLSEPKHYDAAATEAFVRLDWERSLPSSATQEQRDQLFGHLHNVLFSDSVISPFPIDAELVARKRDQLAGYSLSQRAYSRLKGRLLNDPKIRDFTIAEAGGPQSAMVFARASGKPLTQGIPGLFTRDGYYDVFLGEASAMLGLLEAEDVWVLGKVAQQPKQQLAVLTEGSLQRDLKSLYLHEYVGLWDAYLADIRLIETQSMSRSIEIARILAAPDSPIAQFLRGVARETTLIKPVNNADSSLLANAARRVTSTTQDLERAFGPNSVTSGMRKDDRLERIVDDRFEPIRRLVSANGGAVPMDGVLRMFSDLYMNLTGVEASLQTRALGVPSTEALTRLHAEAGHLPAPLRGMVEGLANSGTSQAEGGIQRTLGGEMESSLGDFCRRAIRGRYPFNRSSTQDVTQADFARMFAPGGLLDQFFNSRLASMADLSGPTWMLRQPGGAQMPLVAFQKGARIRDVFFPSGGRAIDLSFEFSVLELDASVDQLSLDFDGQVFRYAHGPQLPNRVTWPGSRGSNQVRLTLSNRSSGEKYLVKNGPWALFRLFDEGEVRPGSSPERFVVALSIEGKRVVLDVTANSVQNPFRLRELASFSCPGRT